MHRVISKSALVAVGIVWSVVGSAKGLDALKPATPTPNAAKPTPVTTTTPVTPTTPAAATPPPADVPPAGQTPKGLPAAATEAVVTPSAASRAMADRLGLMAGIAMLSASASEGEWAARGGAELGLHYELSMMKSPRFALAAGMRYSMFDATVENKSLSYRGVVEGYHFGVIGKYAQNTRLTLFGTGELGMMVVHLKSLDLTAMDDKLNANGVNVSLGGGADWQLQPKLYAGPRLTMGFGRLQTIQVSGNATFVF